MVSTKVLHCCGSPVSKYYSMISVHYCRQMLAGALDDDTKDSDEDEDDKDPDADDSKDVDDPDADDLKDDDADADAGATTKFLPNWVRRRHLGGNRAKHNADADAH